MRYLLGVVASFFLFQVPVHASQFTLYGSTFAVLDSGSVGIGTTSPGPKLEVDQTGGDIALFSSIQAANDNPVRFKINQSNSSVGLVLDNSNTNKAAGMRIQPTGELTFNTGLASGGTLTNATEKVRIDTSGNVGIGTTAPGYLLDVSSAAHATSFVTSSDIRFKENIKPLENVLEKLKRLRGVSFDWNARYKKMGRATAGKQIGMIAQEVEKEFPELVTTWRAPDHPIYMNANDPRYEAEVKKLNWVNDYRSMDYNRFTAVLLEAIKEQQKEIEELNAKVQALQKGK